MIVAIVVTGHVFQDIMHFIGGNVLEAGLDETLLSELRQVCYQLMS